MSALYGMIASFDSAHAVARAARRLRRDGYRQIEAYTPFPVEGLDRSIPAKPKWILPAIMLFGAAFGGAYGFWIQYWDEAVNFPINVGGRPYDSWPAFIVGGFEFMLLCSVAAGFVGLLLVSGLPRLAHPVFNSRLMPRATRDRFLLCVEAEDPHFETRALSRMFEELGAEVVEEIYL